jgi:hypothetical protein
MPELKTASVPGKKKQPSTKAPQAFSFTTCFMEAKQAAISGDFTQWSREGIPLKKGSGDEWTAILQLQPGDYQYRLVVDGQWCDDPRATLRVQNPYGTTNCVLRIR